MIYDLNLMTKDHTNDEFYDNFSSNILASIE